MNNSRLQLLSLFAVRRLHPGNSTLLSCLSILFSPINYTLSKCILGGAAGIRTRVQLSRQIASTLQVYL